MWVSELERELRSIGFVLQRLCGDERIYTHARGGDPLVVRTQSQHHLVAPTEVARTWRSVAHLLSGADDRRGSA
jgi:predicted RNA binding protein YcfA (HicA-like mRNA interferase family)